MVGTVRDHFSEPGDPLRVGGILSDELPCDIFCQMIIFTCHRREAQMLRALQAEFQIVEI